jgi:fructose-bisphosphate aldolase class II
MARITLRQLLDHAAEHGYGVPAFNINNMEQGLAIMEAAKACNAPVIMQASRGARSYAGDIMLSKMIDALTEMYPDIPICMHQDHGNNEATCMSAIRHGFTSVMMDGSLEADMKTPASYDYNVTITERVARMAHWVGASVEGELGVLGSLETGEAEAEDGSGAEGKLSHDQLLTDPDQALDFVLRTKVDALAIACGTSHGAYKFSRKPDGDILAMNVIEAIHARSPTRISSCTAPPRCRRSCRTSSTPSAARCRRPSAFRSRRSFAASGTACARSTSTPTAAWR